MLPANSAHHHTKHTLKFFSAISDKLNIDPEKVRVGLVPRTCPTIEGFSLDTFHKKSQLIEGLNSINVEKAKTGILLNRMRTLTFSDARGARRKVKKMAVVVVDRELEDVSMAATEAWRARVMQDIEIFVVSIGKGASDMQVRSIASRPWQQHVFHVASYKHLMMISRKLAAIVNKSCASKYLLEVFICI